MIEKKINNSYSLRLCSENIDAYKKEPGHEKPSKLPKYAQPLRDNNPFAMWNPLPVGRTVVIKGVREGTVLETSSSGILRIQVKDQVEEYLFPQCVKDEIVSLKVETQE